MCSGKPNTCKKEILAKITLHYPEVEGEGVWEQVQLSKLELFLEGVIGNPAAWGAGGAELQPPQMGFQAIRVKVVVEGDAPREVLDEIVAHANFYSPVANSMRNPIAMSVGLA